MSATGNRRAALLKPKHLIPSDPAGIPAIPLGLQDSAGQDVKPTSLQEKRHHAPYSITIGAQGRMADRA